MSAPLPPWYDDLAGTLAEGWAQLVRGAADRRHPCHTITVATAGLDGAPQLRTVVLRAAEPSARRMRFHTDARSRKVAELEADPRIAVHAYNPAAKIQIRLWGRATVHREDEVAATAWARTRPFSRVCYRLAQGPGTKVPDPSTALAEAGEGPEAGREAFVAVTVAIARLEFLFLASAGHRRALYDWATGGQEASWLVP
ncbi:pyridoxamine 5'-phosphate oxidase family protein [Elioraea rosea]|uniref:pyridoxamine 5'-phosphate oxidase family protein n=1 Tax=Elioraea rosea TaxID=2492390 RepID=UPI00118566C0|nr:pyridoxamine 5'-phosphate oxidase family protein [Elioraea rosea]